MINFLSLIIQLIVAALLYSKHPSSILSCTWVTVQYVLCMRYLSFSGSNSWCAAHLSEWETFSDIGVLISVLSVSLRWQEDRNQPQPHKNKNSVNMQTKGNCLLNLSLCTRLLKSPYLIMLLGVFKSWVSMWSWTCWQGASKLSKPATRGTSTDDNTVLN